MNSRKSGRSHVEATLGDALSPQIKDQMWQLRNTLAKQARESVVSQLAEVRPPWRRHPKPTKRDESRPKVSPAREKIVKPSKPKFEYWDFPREAAVRELPPVSISDVDKSRFEELLQLGIDSSNAVGEDLIFILGLDFGTSSTKMIVRLPYEAGEPTIAIPAPSPCLSDNDPYLWQTVLWLKEDGNFIPWPECGATVLNSLKQGLIQGRSDTTIRTSNASVAVNRAQAGTAYLSFAIRYARGWLTHNMPNLFRGRRPVWFVNLGMPTASYDDPKLVEPYRRIGAAALQLAKFDNSVTIDSVQCFLDDPDIARAGASEESAERLGVAVVPETAANVTGFAKSTRNAPGLYLLVDVGAMTLDACVFRLSRVVTQSDRYAFMLAQVRPLGVESFHWFLREGKTQSEFVNQCDRMLRETVWFTKRDRDPKADCWKQGYDVPVFLVGGGAASDLHLSIVNSLDPWLEEHTQNDGIRLLDLPVPRTIELPAKLQNFGRMAVAWGLSYPLTEIGLIMPMSDISDFQPDFIVDLENRLVTKDQV